MLSAGRPCALALALGVTGSPAAAQPAAGALELQNVSDEEAYDVFGVQRPGRAFSAKVTASF
jgi:hypothetical protein